MKTAFSYAVGVIVSAVLFLGAADSLLSQETAQKTRWGEPLSPAVVNPVVRSPLSTFLSLDGAWDFSTKEAWKYRLGVGDTAWDALNFKFHWTEENTRTIEVPGNWESQGVGEPGPCLSWDCEWDRDFWDLRHVYMGFALYRKQIEIPADWSGKAIWLKIGGVRSEAYIWVNGKRGGYINNGCATEKFNIAPLAVPGETAEITALVRNDTPSRKGCLAAPHRFGGFYRSIELEATPNVYIDDVWARGEIDGPTAQTRITVAAADGDGKSFAGKLSVVIKDRGGQTLQTAETQVQGPGEYVLDIPLENGRLWSPEEPNLYIASVVLSDEKGPVHGWDERFGIRKIEVRGKKFYLNGKPYFLRGMGDHNYDPMTLTEMPNREHFRDHMKTYKAAGFNYARHHTHVPLPEYFESADEAGILLQPEIPYYHDMTTEAFLYDPLRDIQELHRHYRRFTSFGTYCCGNEGWLGNPADEIVYNWAKEHDPDRLFLHQDGGRNKPGNSDFSTGGDTSPDFCVGLTRPWPKGKYDFLERPFVAHEYLNLAIKMDSRLEDRFTGARVSPVSAQAWRDVLTGCGLDESWGAATLRAAAKLQGHYQKAGLESARSDFECDGYCFWSITDASIPVTANAVAAQGYLNPFWEPRADGIAPDEFYRFNGPTALLADFARDQPIFVSGEKCSFALNISHYGAEPLAAGNLSWRIVSDGGETLASGAAPFEKIEPGYAGTVGEAALNIPSVERPAAARFEVKIDGTPLINDWECWIFPVRMKKSLAGFVVADSLFDWFAERYVDVKKYGDPTMGKDDILLARPDDPAVAEALDAGHDLFVTAKASPNADVQLGWWALGSQVGTAFADSPVWGDFPTARWMNALWFRMIRKGGHDLKTPTAFGPITPLAVGEGRDSYYLYLGRARRGESDILASYALELTQDTPEALWLLDSLLESVKTDRF